MSDTPAFPTAREALDPRATGWRMEDGMTLRDYFAAHALPIAAKGAEDIGKDFLSSDNYDIAARAAYDLADEMLKAREEKHAKS